MLRGPIRTVVLRIAAVGAVAQLATVGGCAASPAPPAATPPPTEATADEPAPAAGETHASDTPGASGPMPLVLGAEASFADLVAAAQRAPSAQAAQAAQGGGGGACLLAHAEGSYGLGVEPAPAASTWPQPGEASLGSAPGPGRVLTAWGLVGDSSEGPLFMAFTPLPASAAQAVGLLVELDGPRAHLRRTDNAAVTGDALDADAVALTVVEQRAQGNPTVYVAASARTALRDLHALLHRLPVDAAVALAVALPPGSTMPAAKPSGKVPARCPDGLPEPAQDAAEGELPREQLVAAIAPLKEGARGCFESATGEAAAGGRVVVALRIGARGTVDEACIASATLGDAVLDTCIAETARQLRFAVPSPRGIVDVHLPLQLAPVERAPPRAVCP